MHRRDRWSGGGTCLLACGVLLSLSCAGNDDGVAEAPQEWSYFGGSKAFQRYSALDQIDRDNVGAYRSSGAATASMRS